MEISPSGREQEKSQARVRMGGAMVDSRVIPHIPAIARLSGTETWAPRAEQWDASRFNPHLASDEGRGRIPPSLEELIARKDNWRANNGLSHCPWDSVPACCKEGHLKLNQKGRSEIQKRVGESAVRGDRGLPTDRRLEQSRAREALEIKRTLFCSPHDHSFECNDSDSEIVADALNLEVPCSQSEHSVSQSPHDTSENLTVDLNMGDGKSRSRPKSTKPFGWFQSDLFSHSWRADPGEKWL